MSKNNRLRAVQELLERSIRAIPEVESVTIHIKKALNEIVEQQKKKENKTTQQQSYADRWNKDLRDSIRGSIINPMSVKEAKTVLTNLDAMIKAQEDEIESIRKSNDAVDDVLDVNLDLMND